MNRDQPTPIDPHALAIAEELPGPRLTLRRLRVSDAEELLAALIESRPRLRPWLGFHEAITTLDEAREWLAYDSAKWERREGFHYGLRLPPTGALIGALHMHTIHWEIPSFALGYWLRSGYDGQGYMTEAVRVGTDYLFTQAGARRVSILCDTRNTRSAAVAERLGFVRGAAAQRVARPRWRPHRRLHVQPDRYGPPLAIAERADVARTGQSPGCSEWIRVGGCGRHVGVV